MAAAPASEPLHVAIIVDMSAQAGPAASIQDLRSALGEFVKAIRTVPDSKVSLVEVAAGAVTTADFDAEPAELDQRIGRLFPSQQQGTVFLEAYVEASRRLGESPGTRRVILSIQKRPPV